jgi:hypothetical protein
MQAKKPKASDRGEYKIAIFFINHSLPTGRAFTMRSNKSQDQRNLSANRFKRMVSVGKFSGTVNWAGLYHNEWLVAEFTDSGENTPKTWHHRDGKTQKLSDMPENVRILQAQKQRAEQAAIDATNGQQLQQLKKIYADEFYTDEF